MSSDLPSTRCLTPNAAQALFNEVIYFPSRPGYTDPLVKRRVLVSQFLVLFDTETTSCLVLLFQILLQLGTLLPNVGSCFFTRMAHNGGTYGAE